ncbi:MAG: ABC transporter substrate-binding protein [Elusimicrobiota bacterium]
MHTNKIIVSLVLLFFIFTGCGKKIITENTIRLPMPTDIKGFDPAYSEDLYSNTAMSQIYEPLMQYAYLERPYKVEPCLAESMPEISADGLIYTFKIKKGVVFQDDSCFKETNGKGRELTADDFIYSFKRIADVKNRSTGWWVFDNKIEGLNEFREKSKTSTDYSREISGLKAVDKYTLKVKLLKPYPQFLYILTMTYTAAVPQEAVNFYAQEFINHPVGTGPYKLDHWTRNSEIVFIKNPAYRKEYYPSKGEENDKSAGLLNDSGKQIPFIDKIVYTIFLEQQPMWLNFLKGEIDRSGIPKDNYSSAISPAKELVPELAKKGIQLWKVPSLDTTYTGFNMEDPILGKNKKLRQAICLACDINKTIELFYNGRAIAAQTPIPPGLDGYDPDFKNQFQNHDLSLAKKYLAEAGYPGGKGLPPLTFEASGSDTTSRQISEMFKKEMEEIGIRININFNTWPEFLGKMNTKRAQIFGLAWAADYPDAENFLQLFYGPNGAPGPNNTNFNNPEFNKLYKKISTMNPSPERTRIYKQMVKIIVEECPWALGAHRLSFALNYKWIKNYKPNDVASGTAKYLRIDTQERAKMLKELF